MKVGQEVLLQEGADARRRRFRIVSFGEAHVVLEDSGGFQVLLKRSELESNIGIGSTLGSARKPKQPRKDSSVWMVFVPEGGQPRFLRNPRRHS